MTVKIRVLHIVTYMGRGGLETMLMNYYRHIDRSKVQFDFLVHRSFEAAYDQEIRQLGGKIYRFARLVPWSKKYKKTLKSFFLSHPEYKIVHVHQDCLSSVALQCAEECGIPVRIAHSHSSSAPKNIKYPIKLYYMKKIPLYATHLFACGVKAGNWMFGGNEFKVVNNAIDISKFEYSLDIREKTRRNLGLADCYVIGHVGRFDPVKNHTFLIDIFKAILTFDENWRLLLIGEGKLIKSIQKKTERLGIQDKVIFLGSRNDVNELMQAMDVFVFPSVFEGLPITLIEEQAAGIPAVIADCVSDEGIVTKDLVIKLPLKDSVEKWAKCVIKQVNQKKRSRADEIEAAGYDIVQEANKLEKFYLTQYCALDNK